VSGSAGFVTGRKEMVGVWCVCSKLFVRPAGVQNTVCARWRYKRWGPGCFVWFFVGGG